MKNPIFRLVPKIVICFSQDGCMATELGFKYIGYVTKEYMSESLSTKLYDVQPLIRGSDENRNHNLEKEIAYQIQYLGLNLYIHYV